MVVRRLFAAQKQQTHLARELDLSRPGQVRLVDYECITKPEL